MSNQIFCKIDKEFCNIIYDIAKDRIVVDCGAGRGLFGELYLENTKGKCLSIDLEIPNEPLSKIIESDSRYFCFPYKSIPIFIRPCHSDEFIAKTIISNIYKFDIAMYVSHPRYVEYDLLFELKNFYNIEQFSNWKGEENEMIYILKRKINYNYKWLRANILYISDPMLSFGVESQEQEFQEIVENTFWEREILIDGFNLKLSSAYPIHKNYDILFYDWGGMSLGNSLMESTCRQIVRDSVENPNKYYVICSTFTSYAMEDAMENLNCSSSNIFTSINSFINYLEESKESILTF